MTQNMLMVRCCFCVARWFLSEESPFQSGTWHHIFTNIFSALEKKTVNKLVNNVYAKVQVFNFEKEKKSLTK